MIHYSVGQHYEDVTWIQRSIRIKAFSMSRGERSSSTYQRWSDCNVLGLCLIALLVFGCKTTRRVDTPIVSGAQPAWVKGLKENIQPVRSLAGGVQAKSITASVYHESVERLPRGRPEDLTRRLTVSDESSDAAVVVDRSITETGRAIHAESAGQGLDAQLIPSSQTRSISRSGGVPPSHVENHEDLSHSEDIPLSFLETLYAGNYSLEVDRRITQFGYDYFDGQSYVDESGPVPEDYIIGPEDEIVLIVSGNFNEVHHCTVDRDGRIVVPELGPLSVAGLRFGDLAGYIKTGYEQVRKDFELTVSMGRLRRIKVHVVGHVVQPGLKEIPARSTVINALSAAGGPAKTGSLRQIAIKHSGGDAEESVDLYQFLVHGDSKDVMKLLRPGDVVFVPAIGQTIGVAGYVQRPGIYEVASSSNVAQVIDLAGGLTPFTFTPHVQIERTVDGRGRETLDIELNDAGRQSPMSDGQLLLVGAVDQAMQPLVEVRGEVVRPGKYQYRPKLTVSDLIEQADGLTIHAYLPQAFVSRQVGEVGSLQAVPERVTLGSTRRILVIDLAKAISGEPEHDIPLMPLDMLTIQHRQEATVKPTVSVIGPVQRPGRYELTSGLRVSGLVALAGNVLPEVYYDEAELIRQVYDEASCQRNVERYRFNLGKSLSVSGGVDDPVLENGDQLVIRSLKTAYVTVSVDGEVRFPGQYVFPAGVRITDLIAAAGGVLDHADLRAAVFARRSVQRLQQERFQHLVERTRRTFEGKLERLIRDGKPNEGVAGSLALEHTKDLLARMSQQEMHGRVVIPFLSEEFPASPYNLTLEDGDSLLIPRRQETVAVIGHVFNPSCFVAEPGITVDTVLDRAGGISEYGDESRLYVIRADGQVQSIDQNENRLTLAMALLPGDVVLVPRSPLDRTFGAQLEDVLEIMRMASQIAMLSSHLGDGSELTVTNVFEPPRDKGVAPYTSEMLRKR